MMRLADFIRTNRAKIVAEWEAFARTQLPAAAEMTPEELRDEINQLLDSISLDMERPQTREQQAAKAKGGAQSDALSSVGGSHGAARVASGFKLDQVVSEFRALRASVVRLWEESLPSSINHQRGELTRFNEAIDQALEETVHRFFERQEETRERFLAILGHDLRNPLGAIIMAAKYLLDAPHLAPKHAQVASRILRSGERVSRMVNDLLDYARTRLGQGLPIQRTPVDFAVICRQLTEELVASHPDRAIRLDLRGDLSGEWDADRVAQVVSNLVGNALQHGELATPVTVTAHGDEDAVWIAVHNEGAPIPKALFASIFEPGVARLTDPASQTTSLGLGLHIAREIVVAHAGTIELTSSAAHGTTFLVRLPRYAPEKGRSASRQPAASHHDAHGGLHT